MNNARHFQDAGIDRILTLQARIDGLQRVIDYDPGALGVRNRITAQIRRLRSELIDTVYNSLPEGLGD